MPSNEAIVYYQDLQDLIVKEQENRLAIEHEKKCDVEMIENQFSGEYQNFLLDVPVGVSIHNIEEYEELVARRLIDIEMMVESIIIEESIKSTLVHITSNTDVAIKNRLENSQKFYGTENTLLLDDSSYNDDYNRCLNSRSKLLSMIDELYTLLAKQKKFFEKNYIELQRQLLESSKTRIEPVQGILGEFTGKNSSRSSSVGSCTLNDRSTSKNSLSQYKIFAYLAERAQSSMPLDTHFPETELTDDQLKKMRENYLLVESPSGHFYSLSEGVDGLSPKAVLTAEQAKPDPNESRDKGNYRLAWTIMNMIDNILSRSDVVDVKTDNPFVATIAHEYIEYIKSHKRDLILSSHVSCADRHSSEMASSKEAKEIFKNIEIELENLKAISSNPALQYRHEYECLRNAQSAEELDENISRLSCAR